MDKPCYVYEITHRENKTIYVGIAVNPAKRWEKHTCNNAKHNDSPKLKNALQKYGKDAFAFEVIDCLPSKATAGHIETLMIAVYRLLGQPVYNISSGGDTGFTGKHSEEAKAKMRASWAKRKAAGFTQSEEYRKKQSLRSRGRKHSAEAIAKMSAAKKGKVNSEAHKQKIREARLGKKASEESRAKMSATRRGKPGTAHSEETKAYLSALRKEKCKNPEFKERMLANLGEHARRKV